MTAAPAAAPGGVAIVATGSDCRNNYVAEDFLMKSEHSWTSSRRQETQAEFTKRKCSRERFSPIDRFGMGMRCAEWRAVVAHPRDFSAGQTCD